MLRRIEQNLESLVEGVFGRAFRSPVQPVELARKLGTCPEDVVILGIEPERVENGQALSPTLESRLDHYVQATRSEFVLAR